MQKGKLRVAESRDTLSTSTQSWLNEMISCCFKFRLPLSLVAAKYLGLCPAELITISTPISNFDFILPSINQLRSLSLGMVIGAVCWRMSNDALHYWQDLLAQWLQESRGNSVKTMHTKLKITHVASADGEAIWSLMKLARRVRRCSMRAWRKDCTAAVQVCIQTCSFIH